MPLAGNVSPRGLKYVIPGLLAVRVSGIDALRQKPSVSGEPW